MSEKEIKTALKSFPQLGRVHFRWRIHFGERYLVGLQTNMGVPECLTIVRNENRNNPLNTNYAPFIKTIVHRRRIF